MKNRRGFFVLLLLSASLPSAAMSQRTQWNAVTASRDTVRLCTLDSINQETLYLTRASHMVALPLDSIRILIEPRQPYFLLGAVIGLFGGATVGAIVGALVSLLSSGSSADTGWFGMLGCFIGALGGLLLGPLIADIVGHDRVVDLSTVSRSAKILAIEALIRDSAPVDSLIAE